MKKKVYILAFLFFLLDRISKIIILNIDKYPIKVIKNFFYIEKSMNSGAAFSILSGFLVIFVTVAVCVLFYIDNSLIKEIKNRTDFISISMIIGGIIGNLFDRLIYGKVIDFSSFKFGEFSFPIFNIADAFICIGAFLLIISVIKGDKNGN